MLAQVKHRSWVFIQGFYYKKGRGRVVHTEEVCKKEGRKINSIHKTCFYDRGIQPKVRELQYPLESTDGYEG